MEFKKQFKGGRDVVGVITVDNRNVVHLNLYIELPVKKKSIFWWRNKIVIERFSVHSKSTEIRHINNWTKPDFERWVDEAIRDSDNNTHEAIKNHAVIKLINEQ